MSGIDRNEANPPRPARRNWSLFGPLFHYDLVASARRGRHTVLRCVTALVLLVTLMVSYSWHIRGFDIWQPFAAIPAMPAKDQATFADSFARWCVIVQMIGLFLLTPTIVADTIAREKENRTIEFLFVTDLTDREIILGKLFSRLAYLVGVLLAALPIMALTQLFGGVDLGRLFCGFVIMLSSLFAIGAMSVFCSITGANVLDATIRAYIVTVAYGMVSLCCLSCLPFGDGSWTIATVLIAVANGFIGVKAVLVSINDLRPAFRRRASPPLPLPERPMRRASHQLHVDRVPLLPIFESRPLLWKEVCQPSTGWGARATPWVFLGAIVAPIAFIGLILGFMLLNEPREAISTLADFSRGIVAALTVIFAGILGFLVLRHAASSVTRERERNTLAALLTLPIDREEILEAKWLGGFAGWWPFLLIMLSLVLFGLLAGGLTLTSAFVLIVAVAAPLEFLASLGLWLSVVSRDTLRANLAAILCLLLVATGPQIIGNYIELAAPVLGRYGTRMDELIVTASTPPLAWVRTVMASNEASPPPEGQTNAILWGAFGYAVGAWLLWRDACRRIRRLG